MARRPLPKSLHKPSFRDVIAENNRAARGMEAMYGDLREAKGIPAPVITDLPPKRDYVRKEREGLSELQHQIRVITWWDKNCHLYNLPPFALFAIPNGGGRGLIDAANLKRSGVRPGIEDLFLAVPRNEKHGLFIELKADEGEASDEQVSVSGFHRGQAYRSVMCWGHVTAIEAIEHYLAPPF